MRAYVRSYIHTYIYEYTHIVLPKDIIMIVLRVARQAGLIAR